MNCTVQFIHLTNRACQVKSYRTVQFILEWDMKDTDAKRQAILDAAYRLFRAQGFEGTSISEITAQFGGSRATIYSHFPSKEELFVECMTAALEDYITGAVAQLNTSGTEPAAALREFGAMILNF